jgi:hypothetical protein
VETTDPDPQSGHARRPARIRPGLADRKFLQILT